jgi:hypothetical protein
VAYELEGDSDIASWIVEELPDIPPMPDPPGAADSRWNATKPSLSMTEEGSHSFRAWAKDQAGNVSNAPRTITVEYDVTAPSVDSFSFSPSLVHPGWTTSPTVGYLVSSPAAEKATAWLVTESASPPAPDAAGWSAANAGDIVLSPGDGLKTLHAWAKDAAGNVCDADHGRTLSVSLDTRAPRLLTIDPWPDPSDGTVEGRRLSRLREITFKFNEEVLGADLVSSYSIAGPSGAALVKDHVVPVVAGKKFRLVLTGETADPTDADPLCRITLTGITDLAGNALEPCSFDFALQAPTDAYLLLDVSGSMNATPAGSTRKKIEYLRDSADAVAALWNVHSTNGDRLGILTFSTYPADPVSTDPADPLSGLVEIQSPGGLANLRTKIAAISANGSTALGAGLATALEKLGYCPAGRRRAVILFSDGMQNQEPKVDDSTAGSAVIRQSGTGASRYSGGLALPHALDTGIPVHSIGIGAAGTWHDLLHTIAEVTGGNYHEESELWPNLTDAMVDDFVDCFRDGSPQILRRATGTLAGGSVKAPAFRLSGSTRRLTILATWPDGGPIDIELSRGGKPVTIPAANTTTGSTYRLSTIIVDSGAKSAVKAGNPARAKAAVMASSGDWQVTLRKGAGATVASLPYSLTIIVEDHGIDLDFFAPPASVLVGEEMRLSALLDGRRSGIQAVHSLSATVIAPRLGFGDVLKANEPNLRKALNSLQNPMKIGTEDIVEKEQLLPILLASIPQAGIDLAKRQQPAPLALSRRQGTKAGMHDASYIPTVPGLHTVIFTVVATLMDGSAVERTERRTFVARLRVSSFNSEIKAFIDKKEVIVDITPLDDQNHYYGPGYASQVQVHMAGLKDLRVIDNLDGSYKAVLTLDKAITDPKARIKVDLGATVFAGEIGTLAGLAAYGKKPQGKPKASAPAGKPAKGGGRKA